MILIFGILGLVVCSPLAIAAWVMGNKALEEIDSSGQVYSDRGTVKAGQIMGIIGTVILIVTVVAIGTVLAIVVAAEANY